mmetsp:Transcript_47023/g.131027  ORF Transcript_47023/g.131027 Transcript_47023/m.131027 type:complete len:374 (-) Transcript_47023:238-1359(-)
MSSTFVRELASQDGSPSRVAKTDVTRGGHRVAGTCQSRSTSAGSSTSPHSNTSCDFSPNLKNGCLDSRGASPFLIRDALVDAFLEGPASSDVFPAEPELRLRAPTWPPAVHEGSTFPPGLENFAALTWRGGTVARSTTVAAMAPWTAVSEDDVVPRACWSDRCPISRPPGLDAGFHEENERTLPVSSPSSLPPGLENLLAFMDEGEPSLPSPSPTPSSSEPSPMRVTTAPLVPFAGQGAMLGFVPPPPAEQAPALIPVSPPPAEEAPVFMPAALPPPPADPASDMCVLSLDKMLMDPAPASVGFPSVGSAGHQFGYCKPCAFVHTRGCSNGTNCSFCHLCPPDERKRRKAGKKEQRKDAGRRALPQDVLAALL